MLLLLLLPVCCFAPGFFFVRLLRWNPLEKLCASVGLSLILIYLVSWGIYCSGARGNHMPVHPMPYFVVSVVCAAMGAIAARDIVRLMRTTTVRRALAGFGFLLLWTAVLTAIIRNFSGSIWFGDWLEHFQRSLFFLQHFPADTPIPPAYVIPSRPPMMNVLAAFFLAQTADRFELFQTVFVFLNVLLFLPCYLMMPALGKRAKRRTWLLVLLFCASPLVMQNTSYAWTKATAAFYVVLAIWFYLAGWRKVDSLRTIAAFVWLAAGLLVHYSAGPYVAILTLHYFVRVFPERRNKWRELAAIAAVCGLVLSTWLVWSLAVYGPHATFASNTSVTSSKEYGGSTAGKIAGNLFDSVLPLVVRDPGLLGKFAGQRTSGELRDCFFVFYQQNAVFAMGLVGGPLVLWLVYRALWRKRPAPVAQKRPGSKRPAAQPLSAAVKATPEVRFWRVLIIAGFVVGIAVVGERDTVGVGHLTLLSLQVLGISMLAAVIPWRHRALAALVLAGCAFDFSCGVLLQAHVESLENSASSTVFPNMVFTGTTIAQELPGPDSLSTTAWNNWFLKNQISAYRVWLNDMMKRFGSLPDFQEVLPSYQGAVEQAGKDDQHFWQGWFTRHEGRTTFLGDHVAGWFPAANALAQALLVLMFVGLAAKAYRTV